MATEAAGKQTPAMCAGLERLLLQENAICLAIRMVHKESLGCNYGAAATAKFNLQQPSTSCKHAHAAAMGLRLNSSMSLVGDFNA